MRATKALLLIVAAGACGSSGSGSGPVAAPPSQGSWDAARPGTDAAASSGAGDGAVEEPPEVTPSDAGAPADGAVGEDGPPPEGQSSGHADALMPVYVTFYGWDDNSPPGRAIAYPRSGGNATVHDAAGGSGTFADPITFATDKDEFAVGTLLYLPFIEKFVVMEDDCAECDSDWASSRKLHIDIWMNSNGTESPASLNRCEGQWTRSSTNVEVSPPPTRPVTTAPLFDATTNACRSAP